jgi:hypothetical protein
MGEDITIPYSISLQKEIARGYDYAGEFEEAYCEYNRLFDMEETHYGKRHRKTLTTVARLARLLEIRGELKKSHMFHCRAWKGRRMILDENDPATKRSARAATRLARQLQQPKLPSRIIFNSDTEPVDSSTPTDTACQWFRDNTLQYRRASRRSSIASGHSSDGG